MRRKRKTRSDVKARAEHLCVLLALPDGPGPFYGYLRAISRDDISDETSRIVTRDFKHPRRGWWYFCWGYYHWLGGSIAEIEEEERARKATRPQRRRRVRAPKGW